METHDPNFPSKWVLGGWSIPFVKGLLPEFQVVLSTRRNGQKTNLFADKIIRFPGAFREFSSQTRRSEGFRTCQSLWMCLSLRNQCSMPYFPQQRRFCNPRSTSRFPVKYRASRKFNLLNHKWKKNHFKRNDLFSQFSIIESYLDLLSRFETNYK